MIVVRARNAKAREILFGGQQEGVNFVNSGNTEISIHRTLCGWMADEGASARLKRCGWGMCSISFSESPAALMSPASGT